MNFWKVVHKPVEEKVTKASEYAANIDNLRKKLERSITPPFTTAIYVTDQGKLAFACAPLDADEALVLAKWILETFQ